MKRRDFIKGCLGCTALLSMASTGKTALASQMNMTQEEAEKLLREIEESYDALTVRANSHSEPDQILLDTNSYTLIYKDSSRSFNSRLEIYVGTNEDNSCNMQQSGEMSTMSWSYLTGSTTLIPVGESRYISYKYVNDTILGGSMTIYCTIEKPTATTISAYSPGVYAVPPSGYTVSYDNVAFTTNTSSYASLEGVVTLESMITSVYLTWQLKLTFSPRNEGVYVNIYRDV